MAESKIHPLWYTEFIPVLFLVSSVFAGLSMVIIEGSISHKVFASRVSRDLHHRHNDITIGLGKICAGAMFVYYFLKVLVLIHSQQWDMLMSGWGAWYLVEVVGFVLFPLNLFYRAVRTENVKLVKVAASLTLVGIILNRLNISVIAFNWFAENPYVPHWAEIWVTATIICMEIWALRWIVNRMPVLGNPPAWARDMDH
jgi:Ni/Fe-hydrogenase subunit HybB-like protein